MYKTWTYGYMVNGYYYYDWRVIYNDDKCNIGYTQLFTWIGIAFLVKKLSSKEKNCEQVCAWLGILWTKINTTFITAKMPGKDIRNLILTPQNE